MKTMISVILVFAIGLYAPGMKADFDRGVEEWEAGRYREATTQWLSAANAEDGRAMLELGKAYLQGLGVLQDVVEAHKWFNLAASYGISEAIKERDALDARISAEERAEARKLAKQWQPEPSVAEPSAPAQSTGTPSAESSEPLPPGAISEAQSLLAALGYQPGPADGVWGPRTESAYQLFLRMRVCPSIAHSLRTH